MASRRAAFNGNTSLIAIFSRLTCILSCMFNCSCYLVLQPHDWNKAFIDIRLRSGIATPPEEDRATVTGDMHKKFREDRSSGSRDMLADRQTDRHTYRNKPLPYRAGVIKSYLVTKLGVNKHKKRRAPHTFQTLSSCVQAMAYSCWSWWSSTMWGFIMSDSSLATLTLRPNFFSNMTFTCSLISSTRSPFIRFSRTSCAYFFLSSLYSDELIIKLMYCSQRTTMLSARIRIT